MEHVQVLFLDVDGVLTHGSTEAMEPDVMEALLQAAAGNIHLVPLTGQDVLNINERFYRDLIDGMPPAMRRLATAYTETGGRCYVYDAAAGRMTQDPTVSGLYSAEEQDRLRDILRTLRKSFPLSSKGRDVTEAWLSVTPLDRSCSEQIAVRMIRELRRAEVAAHVFLTATGDLNAVRHTKAFGVQDYLARRVGNVPSERLRVTAIVDSVGAKTVTDRGEGFFLQFNDHPIVSLAAWCPVPLRVINVGPRHEGFHIPDWVVQLSGGPQGLLQALADERLLWNGEQE